MRTSCLSAICLSLIAAGCSAAGDRNVDSATGAVNSAQAAAASSVLRSVAGAWEMTARPTSGRDSTPTRVRLNATPDTTGWTMVLGRQTVPLHVRVSGDTIITSSDPYSSFRRPGVTVRTNSTQLLDGERLVGTTIAHYVLKGADSVLVFRTEARRMQ